MNSEALLESFLHSPRLFQLADRLLLSAPQRIACKNLQGSSPAFLISAVFQQEMTRQMNHLVVCEDAEAAAYLHNTVESLTGALDLFYFPASFKNKKNYRLLNSSHVMLRTEDPDPSFCGDAATRYQPCPTPAFAPSTMEQRRQASVKSSLSPIRKPFSKRWSSRRPCPGISFH
jgi:hypothetical protein